MQFRNQGLAFLPDGGALPAGSYPVYVTLEVTEGGAVTGEVHFASEPQYPRPISIGKEFDLHVPHPNSILGDNMVLRVRFVDESWSVGGYAHGSPAQFNSYRDRTNIMRDGGHAIKRLDVLIAKGERVLATYNQPGNIDAHDLWYTESKTALDVLAPEFAEALGSVAPRMLKRWGGEATPRAVYEFIQGQIEVLRAARGALLDKRLQAFEPKPVAVVAAPEPETEVIGRLVSPDTNTSLGPAKEAGWNRGEKIAAWTLGLMVIAVAAAIAVVPEVRRWLHLEKPTATSALVAGKPAEKPVEEAAQSHAQAPTAPPATDGKVTGMTAPSLEELRKRNGLVRIEEAESGKTVPELPAGIFGFTAPYEITHPGLPDRVPLSPDGSINDFEIQKLTDGKIQIVAFVGQETREYVRSGLSVGDRLTLYSDRWKEAQNVVALPATNIKCDRIRYVSVALKGRPDYISALDCRVSSAK